MEAFRSKKLPFSIFRSDKTSYSLELKYFVQESRKCQTLYANCEGSYNRRIFDSKDNDTLERFIYNTMYYDGVLSWEVVKDSKKRLQVKKIQEAITSISDEFNLHDEIHLGVVWVYYFLNKCKTQKSVPVFKIFRYRSGDRAVFLDCFLRFYHNWDSYLACNQITNSLLCVPRNGFYSFGNGNGSESEKLDLEFVVSRNLTSDNEQQLSVALVPYSHVTVRYLLGLSKERIAQLIRELKQLLSAIWEEVKKNKDKLVKIVVFGLLALIKLKETRGIGAAVKAITENSLMILNTRSATDLLEVSHFGTRVEGFRSFRNGVDTVNEFGSKAGSLVKLLKSKKKNWRSILSVVCDVCRDGRSILMTVSLLGNSPMLGLLIKFLYFISELKRYVGEDSFVNKKNDKIDSLPEVKCPDIITSGETEVSHGAELDLSLLDKTSAEKIILGELQSPTENSFFLGEEDNYGLFLMTRASVPCLTYRIGQLYGTNINFKPLESVVHSIYLDSGENVGTLFFPSEFVAIGWLSLKEMKKPPKKSLCG